MQLISIEFFAFFVLSLILYYIFPSRYRYLLLLLFSWVFFLCATPKAFPFILLSSVTVWWAALKKTKAVVTLCIILNVLFLALTKYMEFAVTIINSLINIWNPAVTIPVPEILAPIGISYYTMSLLGYLLDVYWGKEKAQPNLAKTMLFVGYYPQLTSGPVTRYGEVAADLYSGKTPSYENITYGMQRILWGAFKKLIISTRAQTIVNTIYNNTELYNGFYIPVAASLFLIGLYADFSGCMDIIIGASECYGIRLPENFRAPFLSQTVREFWQRWHISLGAWFRDYIMYPLLKSSSMSSCIIKVRKKTKNKFIRNIPTFVAMLVVWLLLGLWHGGAWKYILGMGLWYWGLIVLSDIIRPVTTKIEKTLKINTESSIWKGMNSVRIFIIVAIGNMFFRLPSLGDALHTMHLAVTNWNPHILCDGSLYDLGVNPANFIILIIAVIIMAFVSVAGNRKSVRQRLAEKNLVFRWIILLLLIWCVVVFGIYGPGYNASDFIYGNF